MDFLVMRVFVKIWWIFPFTFVFSLLFAIRETVKDGPNDLKYALAAAVSLFILFAFFFLESPSFFRYNKAERR